MHFEFPFILIGKLTMAFLTGQSWQVLKSGNTGGTQKNDSSTVLQMDLTRVLWRRLCGQQWDKYLPYKLHHRYYWHRMITNLHKTDTKRTTHLRNLTHLADGLCCLSQEHQLAMKWTQKMRNTRPANRHGTAAKRNKACQWIKEREILKIIINTLARKWFDQFFKFRTFCEPRNKKHLEQVD